MNLTILFEDNHILVCVKPQGVLSQGGDMNQKNMVDELKSYIKVTYQKPGNVFLGLVHRLDLNVGGVMVFAKTSKAARRLSDQIRNHSFKKRYLAIVKGTFEPKEGVFQDYLDKDTTQRQAIISDNKKGKLASLHYFALEEREVDNEVYSLVDIELITGKFHQIRFQFAHHNHPLYGDSKYGTTLNKDFFLGLFAYELVFEHPTKKTVMKFRQKPLDSRFTQFKHINKIDWSIV